MGRKAVTVVFILVILLAMCGCSHAEANNHKGYATVYIKDKAYDLTQDITALGGQLAEQGFYVGTSVYWNDEAEGTSVLKAFAILPDGTLTDGFTYKERLQEENECYHWVTFYCIGGLDRPEDELEYIMASAKNFTIRYNEDYSTTLNNRYRLGDDVMELYSLKYEMDSINNTNACLKNLKKNGVENLAQLSERCMFKGYYTVATNGGPTSQIIAVFYDGEPVDLVALMPEDLESAYSECWDIKYGLLWFHRLYTTYPYIMDGNPNKGYEYSDTYFESVKLECAFNYAYLKGAEKIRNGEISEVVAISFDDRECQFTVMKADDLLLNYDKETDSAYFNRE